MLKKDLQFVANRLIEEKDELESQLSELKLSDQEYRKAIKELESELHNRVVEMNYLKYFIRQITLRMDVMLMTEDQLRTLRAIKRELPDDDPDLIR